jgi:ABC-type spermidine/putrescine transport system permease subunit I
LKPAAGGYTPASGPAVLKRMAPAILLGPSLVLFAVLFVAPLIGLGRLSLSDPAPFGFSNYTRFLFDSYYLAVLGGTLLLGVLVTALCIAVGLPLAYVLARLEWRFAPFLLLLTTFPLWVSAVVRSFAWMVLFFRGGLVTELVKATGLVPPSFQLMYTFSGLVIALAQVLLPLFVITLYGIIRGIDRDLENAAMNLGASPAFAAIMVTMRLARGGIFAGSLLVFSFAISAFATPILVGGVRAHLMAVTIQEQTLELLDWPFAAALSILLLLIGLAVAFAYGRLVNERTDR